jgi:hypothetical protein
VVIILVGSKYLGTRNSVIYNMQFDPEEIWSKTW